MKVGIITHYYNSLNYGGNLQAYALVKVLQKYGYFVEQICYDSTKDIKSNIVPSSKKIGKIPFNILLKKVYNKTIKLPYKKIVALNKTYHSNIQFRRKALIKFNKTIPHSEEVYDYTNIDTCANKYDAFITGSDQVWNIRGCYNRAYWLEFVSGKTKMSYAASIALDSLFEEEKEVIRKDLADFNAISIREKESKKLLESITDKEININLDPTLLLNQEDWDSICSNRIVADKYMFCYFLGDYSKSRKLAYKFAKEHNLRIVNLANMNKYKKTDKIIRDIELYDISPADFISLIKYADFVFTDSFHAVVFSNIYHKQYFVFNRNTERSMTSRIVDIVELFNQKDRYISNNKQENIEYISGLNDIDYSIEFNKFMELRDKSIKYLIDNLE